MRTEERTNDVNEQLGEMTPNALLFPLMPRVTCQKINLRRAVDVSYSAANWLDWKIQQEIMRSDRTKALVEMKGLGGYHECSKNVRDRLQIG